MKLDTGWMLDIQKYSILAIGYSILDVDRDANLDVGVNVKHNTEPRA